MALPTYNSEKIEIPNSQATQQPIQLNTKYNYNYTLPFLGIKCSLKLLRLSVWPWWRRHYNSSH